MEGVQCHLRGRLSQRLSRQRAHHLARITLRLLEARLNFTNQPFESFGGESMLFGDIFRAER